MKVDVLATEWNWHWRSTNGEADCGIYAEVRPGHAYAIVRCPRYANEKQWAETAQYICGLHNTNIQRIRDYAPTAHDIAMTAIAQAKGRAGKDQEEE